MSRYGKKDVGEIASLGRFEKVLCRGFHCYNVREKRVERRGSNAVRPEWGMAGGGGEREREG